MKTKKQKLQELRDQHKILGEKIEALESEPEGNEFVGTVVLNEHYNGIHLYNGEYEVFDLTAATSRENQFKDKKYAAMIAEALNIWMELASQPGVVRFVGGTKQYFISHNATTDWLRYGQQSELCPLFRDRESAENAIEAVGREKINRMFSLWHFNDPDA